MRFLALCAAAFAAAVTALALLVSPAEAPAKGTALLAPGDSYLLASIAKQRRTTWRWQAVMGKRPTHATRSEMRSPQPAVPALGAPALGRARAARAAARRPVRRAARRGSASSATRAPGTTRTRRTTAACRWTCTFQRLYGGHLLRRKGTADRWTPLEQMWVAERAYRSGRGFYPWPNTARYCGLI